MARRPTRNENSLRKEVKSQQAIQQKKLMKHEQATILPVRIGDLLRKEMIYQATSQKRRTREYPQTTEESTKL
jgi:hypothetical protein